ncbi:TadE/TadG family type IV pilus assembly protein [Roseivivax isoporae]|uniref:Flp pilus assembly protein TadG n=1 Tax=Roseivivax isoporae LMG 25204 TaxID=1449351 RepID=X7F3Q2_9RHOB|nr:hypothetical protein [Roseivivax isoporae]ETX27378.1 hypothetical protein RISW2_14375 [Roseivivax isoporae LMG 25204]
MIRCVTSAFRRFRDDEDGSMVVPFALWLPVFTALMISGIELGAVSARSTALERALDQTVRDIRLGTGTVYDHDSIKAAICDRAEILPDCSQTLRLEMVRLNIRDWSDPDPVIQCIDTAEEVQPVVSFEYGRENELMMLRACFKYQPISPATGLGSALSTDAAGYSVLVAKAAFVQEPI